MPENPFQTPDFTENDVESLHRIGQTRAYRVGEAIIYWEKLRIIYNVVLGFFTVILVLISGFSSFVAWAEIVLGALVANLCFCAGPFVSGYLAWFDVRSKGVDHLLFVAGVALSLFLAYMVVRF